ncbi:MAG: transglutaminaseTgpA domain-containing protein [Planctomycetaceae bacterium]
MFIPRIWPSQYQLFNDAPIIGARPLTGFTEDVKLGDMGEILENDEMVLEVRLFDADSGAPVDPARYAEEFGSDEPLFRGQVMEIYESAQWQRANPEILLTRRDSRPRPGGNASESERSKEQHRLRQRIRLQPIGSAMLFGTGRVLECRPAEGRGGIDSDPFSGTFRRHEDAELGQPFEYDAFSSRLQSLRSGTGTDQYKYFCLYVPPELDEPLRKFVNEVIPAETPISERAERIRQRLAESEDFTYSLDLTVDDPNVDPVVDFLSNRKRGHCEYYASALALLLRVAGIPSRVVSGFKGGDFNVTTGVFEVRQLHAHLWVEAFDGRYWVPLDPTPGARDETVAQIQGAPSNVLSRMTEAWSTAWSRGVRLSRADQDRMLYEPLREGAISVWNALRDVRGTTSRLKDMLYGLLSSPERWISWRGGAAVFALLLLVSGATVLGRRLWRLLRRIRGDSSAVRRGAPIVAFYERFRRAAARAGYERAGPQTPREFAQKVGEQIGAGKGLPNLSPPIPQFVTENYYRVRYGDEELPSDLLAALQRQLDDFERQLQQSPGAAPQGAG